MLCISMKPGEYFTVGGSTVIQLDRLTGDRVHLTVNAPREVPILRGAVLERNGGKRPDCVFEAPRWHKQGIAWNRSKEQALNAMRRLLSEMDGRDDTVKALRRQLNHMFPADDGGLSSQ